ncbi:sugar ABC transporter permease [Streptomyces sp. DSM 44915]|uniref:Sugar ABC transporter permease n=1 Tax=Streptomyces chisholmiae TaxID=3075540 RepID=A0ABU2JMX0_9ACTN|nr:sugar ABC transporter permease [Streptomyces sp. DSM 44915]MDT0266049.1 sugar ABC transporter permease [Streptomyces sp. DSM 44915]
MRTTRQERRRTLQRSAEARVPPAMRGPVALSILPALVLFALFFLVPLGVLAVTTFARWDGVDFAFTGWDNYDRLLSDPVFWKSVRNTLFYCAASMLIQVPLGVAVGMTLALRMPGWTVFRTVIFIPFVISGAAYALVFSMFYNPSYGLLNNLLGPVTGGTRDWLFDSGTARWAVAGTFVFIIGFVVVAVMAEVAAIPAELLEAAEADGASLVQRQLFIVLPLLRNIIGTVILVRLLVDIGMFDLVYILTAGGPNDATTTLALYAYRSYLHGQWGYANAVGSVILLLGATLIVTVRRVFRIGERAL